MLYDITEIIAPGSSKQGFVDVTATVLSSKATAPWWMSLMWPLRTRRDVPPVIAGGSHAEEAIPFGKLVIFTSILIYLDA